MSGEDEIVVAVYHGKILSKEKVIHNISGFGELSFDELRVVKFGDDEFNLLYMNNGVEITDTCHDSLEEALIQANYEFQLIEEGWIFYS